MKTDDADDTRSNHCNDSSALAEKRRKNKKKDRPTIPMIVYELHKAQHPPPA